MEEQVKTVYDKDRNMHMATISPPYAAVDIMVHIDKYDPHIDLKELFLYNFDVDSNCIEFAFGEKVQHLDDRQFITYSTDPKIHVPPFRIEITHQTDTVNLSDFEFTIGYRLMY
jgi:hypothetical protein